MNPDTFSQITQLTDLELLKRIELLAQREREATAILIAHLAEMEARRLYLQEGYSSLFTYCTRVLRFSERAAYRRMEAAKIGLKFPIVLEMLSAGWINLTTITLLAPELTPANHQKLLAASKHKTRKQIERIVAALRPRPAVPSTIRQLPNRTASLVFNPPSKAEAAGEPATPVLEIRPPKRPVVVPLSAKRYQVAFTATQETHELLERAQDLLRHQIPNGDIGEVIAIALKVLVRELEKEKIAATDRPRNGRGTDPLSRHIPAAVRRQVWKRDGGQCAFVGHNGSRCPERGFLEFHHVEPYAHGGKATVDNIALRCRAHNGFEADLHVGRARSEPG
ncbi:MAG TPA: HNH endonuclease signature motif containing protein [Chloroflexota bacterium]|jgi:hypothetical protein